MDGTLKRKRESDENDKPSRIKQDVATDDISDLEKLRLKNMEEHRKFLESLDVASVVKDLKEMGPFISTSVDPKKRPKKKKINRAHWSELSPRPPSMRLQAQKVKVILKPTEIKIEVEPPTDNRLHGSSPLKFEEEPSEESLYELKTDLKNSCEFDPDIHPYIDSGIDLGSCSLQSFRNFLPCFNLVGVRYKVVPSRIQSLCIHPTKSKRLVIAGSVCGRLGLWDLDAAISNKDELDEIGYVCRWHPHTSPANCLSVSPADPSILYSTSHDGTFIRTDIDCDNIQTLYATDFNEQINHLTWHAEKDEQSFLLAHGNGSVGILDTRCSAKDVRWSPCFERSVRTVHFHPEKKEYFIASSGIGGCQIFDLRMMKTKKKYVEHVVNFDQMKGLTSAFFSGKGNRVVTTCNDDTVKIYKTEDLSIRHPPVMQKIMHNNHSGRFVSVFKASWYPDREDAFLIGSLLKPRRIQVYGSSSEELLGQLRDEHMTTVTPVLACHPYLPFIAGGDSSGRIYTFTPTR